MELHLGDCLEVMRAMPPNSADAIVTDPPYYKVVNQEWDKQWETEADFLAWAGQILDECARLLKPNGAIYWFAMPSMAWQMEGEIRKRFNVLNQIRWTRSGSSINNKNDPESWRRYASNWEAIIFGEHYGADNAAKGVPGYERKCDEARGFIFEPLRAYLDGERLRAGVERTQIVEWFASHGYPKWVTERHSFGTSQWELPTRENYERLRQCFNELGRPVDGGAPYLDKDHSYLAREYEYLKRDYDELKQEFEALRRPHNSNAYTNNTDFWDDDPEKTIMKDRHPTQKPVPLMMRPIVMSTRVGGVVLDPFMGSGTTGVAALKTGRNFVGIEKNPKYYEIARRRLEGVLQQPALIPHE